MFKAVTVHVHCPTQEVYDSIPLPEEQTDDGTLKWKAYDNVTVFEPREHGRTMSASFEFKSYDGDGEDFRFDVRQKNS